MAYELKKLTPNLVVTDVARSLAWYRDVLGFEVVMTVPPSDAAAPLAFAMVKSGGVELMLNSAESANSEYPAFKEQRIGGTLTLFMDVSDITRVHAALKDRVSIVMPLEKKWYGVTEFAFTDPDGYIITFAENG